MGGGGFRRARRKGNTAGLCFYLFVLRDYSKIVNGAEINRNINDRAELRLKEASEVQRWRESWQIDTRTPLCGTSCCAESSCSSIFFLSLAEPLIENHARPPAHYGSGRSSDTQWLNCLGKTKRKEGGWEGRRREGARAFERLSPQSNPIGELFLEVENPPSRKDLQLSACLQTQQMRTCMRDRDIKVAAAC